ncbi:MAG: hypothetical protein NTW99_05030 [Chloroflexi bacterium]|nr:hypothetical protein [Chloroflexota bacterium]
MNTMNTSYRNSRGITSMLKGFTIRRGLAWGVIIIGALLAFEMFNYSTTQFALNDVLGDVKFAGIRWATILALAFCGIDFAGIARLFTPEQGRDEPAEVWYLFGAWLLAAAMNATLTWWGVAVAISSHANLSSEVISSTTLTKIVPVFVAIMVWLIRVLIIGTFSVKGEKLFSQAETRNSSRSPGSSTGQRLPALQPASSLNSHPRPASISPFRPASKVARPESNYPRVVVPVPARGSEPTYPNLSMQSKSVREAEYVDTPRNS